MISISLVWLKTSECMKCDLKKIICPISRGDELGLFSSGSLQCYFGHNPKQGGWGFFSFSFFYLNRNGMPVL